MRFLLLATLLAATATAQPDPAADRYAGDFGAFWQFIADDYAYMDQRPTDWDRVRTLYGPDAAAAPDNTAFLNVLERALGELYDSHAGFDYSNPASPQVLPSGTDLWAEWQGERAVVTQVRRRSGAEAAGLRAGMEIVTVGGRPVAEATEAWMPRTLRADDPEARDWALRTVVAGMQTRGPVALGIADGDGVRAFSFTAGVERPDASLTVDTLDGDIGYVRVNDALGDNGLVAGIDSALATLRHTRGLVLDLRDTPSGGNTTVARAIMSRLVAEALPYQRHELVSEARAFGVRRVWVEYVEPRGPFTYTQPVVVLVGRWTGSMGEGLAIGLDGMGRATVVGSRMAGLLGGVSGRVLPATGIRIQIPTERLTHVDGTPREAFVPPVLVEAGPPGPDAVLARGLAVLADARR